jgi:predicted acetyltransferase
MTMERLVIDGRARLLVDPETQNRIDRAVQEIRAKYTRESQGLGRLVRAKRWFQMRKEIRVALEQIAPSAACYIRR